MTDGAGWARDLGVVVAAVAIANVVFLGVDVPWPIAWVVGVPFLLVLPGYGVVAALFPESGDDSRDAERRPWAAPDSTVRLGLSLTASALVVALVGVGLSYTVGIRRVPAVLSISAVALAGVAVAAIRRRRLEPATRAAPLGDGRPAWRHLSNGSTVQNAATLLAIVLLLGTLGFTGAVPSEGDPYTEFYLLSEDESGNLTAANYSETSVSGEERPLNVGVENRELETVSYEVVIVAQVVSEDGSVAIQQQLDRFDLRLEHGENTTVERAVAPTIVGEEIRLQVLLYKGEAPDNPSAQSADQSLHIWTEVIDGDA
jgi:uncharacterized membrane protein